MSKLFGILFTSLLFIVTVSVFVKAEIPAQELFKQQDIFNMSLSPKGNLLLEVGRNKNQRILNLIDTKTLKKYRISTESINQSTAINSFTWLDDSTLYVQESEDSYVVNINVNASPIVVEWVKIPLEGYIVSKSLDKQGNVIFAQESGDYGEFYRLYKAPLNDLLAGSLSFFEKYRIGLSDAILFYLDEKTNILIGYTYDEDGVQVWYLPPDDIFWSSLYSYEADDKFLPVAFIDENTLAVLTDKDANFTYLAEFDLEDERFTEVLYQHPTYDLIGASLNAAGKLHSVTYVQHGVPNTKYFNAEVQSTKRAVESRIPDREIAVAATDDSGKINLIFAHASNTPGEFYLFNETLNKVSKIGLLRKNLANYTLAKSRTFTVDIGNDVKIEGIVTEPAIESNGILLVNPHGGPIGIRDSANFNLENQFYASRGYTILNANFRGSTGFGKDFQDQGRGQFGKLIEQDIISVYEYYMRDKEFDFTCSMGASYGGYSAMMLAIKYPEYFDCVVSAFGVFDLPHLFNATNHRTVDKNVAALKRVMGDDIPELRKKSPIKMADKVNVPVFLLAGKEDAITPFEQSNRMKYMLNKYGKDVSFHAYENTGHGHDSWEGDIHQHEAIHRFIQKSRLNLKRIINSFKQHDLQLVEQLLGKPKSIGTLDENGLSLLHHAALIEDEEFALQVTQLLIDRDIYIDISDNQGRTALMYAIEENKPNLAELLLAKDAFVDSEDSQELTPLFIAAKKGDAATVKRLIANDVDLYNETSEGYTALMFTSSSVTQAIQVKQFEVAKILIEEGADVDLKVKSGKTLLMNAAINGHFSLVKLLVEHNANTNISNLKDDNKTALDYAKDKKHQKIVDYLTPLTKDKKAFYQLLDKIKNDDVPAALAIIPTLPYINEVDHKGRTAAFYAVKIKDDELAIAVLSALISHGLNINQRDKRKVSAVYVSVSLKKDKQVKFLLSNGADLNQKGIKDWTPLCKAISLGRVDMVKAMSKYPMDLTSRCGAGGWPAFLYITNFSHDAKDVDQAKIGKILLGIGADIEIRTKSGRTALMNSASNGKFEVLKMLIVAGADINATNLKQQNKTALDYAIEDGHDDIADYLRNLDI